MEAKHTPPAPARPNERWRETTLRHQGAIVRVSDHGHVDPPEAVRQMERRLFIKREPVARVVWQAFVSNIESGMQLHHVDGNPQNNAVGNLALVTQSAHAKIEGRCFRQYIPAADYIRAVELHAKGLTIEEIHDRTGIDHRTIRHAVHQADRRPDVLELAFQGVHHRERIRDMFGAELSREMMMEVAR